MEFLKNEYKKEWQFFKKEMKIIFPVMLVSVVLLTVACHFIFLSAYKLDAELATTVNKTLEQAMSGINLREDATWLSIIKLFLHNARACIIAISMGIVPFLFIPIVHLFINSTTVSMVTSLLTYVAGVGLPYFLASLMPHGIFEIPAVVYSGCLGLYICKETSKQILGKSEKRFGDAAIETLRSYVIVVLPLLAIGATTEATLTVIIASKFI